MTSDFLIFATDVSNWNLLLMYCTNIVHCSIHFQLGNLVYFSLEYWASVINYRHLMGVKSIYTDMEGTKLILIDVHNEGYIFCPVNFLFCVSHRHAYLNYIQTINDLHLQFTNNF